MKSVECMGKTVDEAVAKALVELNTTIDKVEIDIIEKGSKGFLKFIGSKPVKVSVKLKKDYVKEAKDFLNSILKTMNIKAEVSIRDAGESLLINIYGENMGTLIGYRGETLDSLQYLTSLVINKDSDEKYKRVILDTQNYRAKREQTLRRLAYKIAQKVRRYNKAIRLEPMNPYERRIIHSELQDDPYVRTFSEGEEPYRRVIVELKKKA
ncbi:R3H domain protein [Clostridium tepidiprofundi DSM 19306]|uniref:RNA-binding protein KhpB n=1 Tax=Clostridium tepidiprofundi DSM 19306 TaxID=1121338 RepID=A0A151B2I8_9CLOT|nr:RNA-binding cell elongation regulator Jag/EloR [Clostridium tepidiprofundi]KYH34118.1 R3H domain protein [Clostridium tepidiprofundi DSM 19306]